MHISMLYIIFLLLSIFPCFAEVRLFDTFLFNNEYDMLELRLREHDKAVDYFIIVEGAVTFTGKPKPLYYELNKERYKQWHEKIIYVIIKDFPIENTWAKEHHSRNYVMETLDKLCKPDDLVLHSDCDEIISEAVLLAHKQAARQGAYCLETDMYYYNTNWKKRFPWNWVFITNYSEIKNHGSLLAMRNKAASTFPHIPKAGWHLSYFLSSEDIAKKIGAFSHSEFDKPEFTNLDSIKQSISNGEDLFRRGPWENCIPSPQSDPLPRNINVLPLEYQRNAQPTNLK